MKIKNTSQWRPTIVRYRIRLDFAKLQKQHDLVDVLNIPAASIKWLYQLIKGTKPYYNLLIPEAKPSRTRLKAFDKRHTRLQVLVSFDADPSAYAKLSILAKQVGRSRGEQLKRMAFGALEFVNYPLS